MPLVWIALSLPFLIASLPSNVPDHVGEHNHTALGSEHVGQHHSDISSSSEFSGHGAGDASVPDCSDGHHGDIHHGQAIGCNHEQELGPQARVAAVMLLGSICYGMALLYLTNAPNKYVRFCTWKMLAMTLSIFIAVLWYQAFDELMEKEIEHRPEDIEDVKGELQFFTFVVIPFLHFMVWYVLLQLHCYFTATRSEVVREAGMQVGSHICAFAFIQPFDSLMDLHPFNLNLMNAIMAVVLGIFVLWSVFMASHVVRLRCLWPHLTADTIFSRDAAVTKVENDMAAISIGLLISQLLRFAIHGELPPMDPVPVYHEQWEASVLLACGVIFILCTVVSSRIRVLAERSGSRWQRFAEAFQLLSVMTMAWVILFWGHWEVYDVQFRDEPLLGRIVLAVCLSILAVVVIFLLRGMMSLGKADITEALMTILEGMALMVAFSWELAFDRAADALADGAVADGAHVFDRHVFKLIMCVFIVLLCVPGYMYFFLPMSLEIPEEATESFLSRVRRETSSSSLGPRENSSSSLGSPRTPRSPIKTQSDCFQSISIPEASENNRQKSIAASDLQSSAPPRLQVNVETGTLAANASSPQSLVHARGELCQFQCFVFSCLCHLLGASRTQPLTNIPHHPSQQQSGIGKHHAGI